MFRQTSPDSLNIIADGSELALTEQHTAQSSANIPEYLLCKNRLQERAQRSTVFVDGKYITSPNTFPHRKAAEQDVASVALASLTQKIKEEGYSLIREDTVFCKSILNEYATKMNLEKPTYTTIQPKGLLPVFISSLVFNGDNHTGEAGRTKKEAEQLAAQAVILSIFGNSESGTVILEIVKSKFKLYAALNKVKDSNISQSSDTPLGPNTGTGLFFPFRSEKEVESTGNGSVSLVVNTNLPFGNEKRVESTGKGKAPLVVNTGIPFGNEKRVESTGNGNAPLVVSTGIPLGNGKEVGITRGDNRGTSTMGNAPLVVNTGIPFGNKKEVGITQGDNRGTSTMGNAQVNTGIPFGNGKEVGITKGANKVTSTTISEGFANQLNSILAMQQPFHEWKKLKREPSPMPFTPTAFVPPAMEQPLSVGPSSAKKRNRKNKKKKKQLQVNTLFRAACSAALNQACPS
ncbi:hypothetical protein Vadar_024800 [Vaccinium darrowii]|uniref:Uncharacterized protein n=1 Tax=Vaccinium darrowii TaxID=229202 RepID=A0ACB7YH43_9ERIC|nr:hypothetical protein Vadar_024800 [Vaccinium darrowii]